MRWVFASIIVAAGFAVAAPASAGVFKCEIKQRVVVTDTADADPTTIYFQTTPTLQRWNAQSKSWTDFCHGSGMAHCDVVNNNGVYHAVSKEVRSSGHVVIELLLDTNQHARFRHSVAKLCPKEGTGACSKTIYDVDGPCKPSAAP
jgi:hypothetical protein